MVKSKPDKMESSNNIFNLEEKLKKYKDKSKDQDEIIHGLKKQNE